MKNLYKDPWKKSFADKFVNQVPPSTPSLQCVGIMEKYLKKILKQNKNPDILILGCTPNTRKLFAKYRIPVTLVDVNKEMYNANNKLMKNTERKEKFIKANWLTMDLKQRYDMILGDIVTNNIPIPKKNQFFNNIKKHLKKDGFFITRIILQPKRLINAEKIIKQYKNREVSRTGVCELWWDIVLHLGLNPKINIMLNKKPYLKFKNIAQKYPYMEKWLKEYEKISPLKEKEWTVFKSSVQKKILKKYLKIKKIAFVKDCKHSNIAPTYILKRR